MLSNTLLPLACLATLTLAQADTSKRGLIYISDQKHKSDDQIWSSTYDLTWYYNYGLNPSPQLSSSKLQFVPMLWGAPKNPDTDTTFLDGVLKLVHDGTPLPHILTFNEPDGTTKTGGSNISPTVAATTWMRQVEPLRKYGIKVGSPAVTGSQMGMTWLQRFFAACNGGCNPDFMAVHWYGNFEGLASYLREVSRTYSNISEIWVTEYALAHADLADSQRFFNQSAVLFDRWE
ncbi:putative glycoside catalytic core protein [Venturia nashicola]|nr:putative glycoside catalytic core protein [Venturia nashicola]